jgi:hypothetical protein
VIDLTARCLNTTQPCSGFEVVCQSEQHKERVEQAHMNRHHDASVPTESVTDDMWSRHADERALIVKAIEATAFVNGGKVDMNVVRQLIPEVVTPQLVGAVVNVLLRQGRLERVGWTTNQDRRGRNVGKPAPLYALVGDNEKDVSA